MQTGLGLGQAASPPKSVHVVAANAGRSNLNLLDPGLSEAGGVELTVDGQVATVNLVRPEVRNAQVPATWRALATVPDFLGPQVRVVILRAEGKSFSAGLDRRMFVEGIAGEPSLFELAALEAAAFDAAIAEFQRGFLWWRDSDALSIAAVAGHAVGAGFQLALAADMIVAADDACFCMKETQLGLVPDLGGTLPLIEAVGYAKAVEICATGRWVSAAEALQLGLAVRVAPRDELDIAVSELVNQLLVTPAGALSDLKRLLAGAAGRTRPEQAVAERVTQRRRVRQLAGLEP